MVYMVGSYQAARSDISRDFREGDAGKTSLSFDTTTHPEVAVLTVTGSRFDLPWPEFRQLSIRA
jgi:hypothetical protein